MKNNCLSCPYRFEDKDTFCFDCPDNIIVKGEKKMLDLNIKELEDIVVNYYYNNHSKDYIEGYLQACYTHHLIKFKDYLKLLKSVKKLFE